MDALILALPYRLPRTAQDAVFALADILEIPRAQVRGDMLLGRVDNAFLLGTMAGVILYRHLPPHKKPQVIARCRKLIAAHLSMGHSLLDRILATWGVTPDWGVWSMSNAELQQALKSDAQFQYWLALVETAGNWDSAGGALWAAIIGSVKGVPVAVIGAILSGAAKTLDVESNYADAKYKEELARRQVLLSSKYYR